MWYIYTMEYYSAMGVPYKEEILSFWTTWMNLDHRIFSEMSQTQINTTGYSLDVPQKSMC
jgi:hypothetical protein